MRGYAITVTLSPILNARFGMFPSESALKELAKRPSTTPQAASLGKLQQAELLALLEQRLAADAQYFGGAADFVMRGVERGLDRFALEIL
jgi:hypothetical protein